MNEITKIHLGRQPFTISVEAYKELKDYLDAIRRKVGPKGEDVVKEVELRVAELLTERGVTGDKVILPEDVDFVKQQLGKPGDFSEEETSSESAEEISETAPKRLFRDTEHGMIAGVAAGLANYFKVDAVFVRIGLVLLTIWWGWGIVLYLILWLIVPELKTKSDRLRSQGKPVTVESLKQVVERADVPAATRRIGQSVQKFAHGLMHILLVALGVLFISGAGLTLVAVMTAGVFMLLRPEQAFQQDIFLASGTEVLLVSLALLAVAMLATFLLLIGMAMVRRKWTLPGWIVATMIGVFLVSVSIGAALAPGVVQDVRQRYEAGRHTRTLKVPEFRNLQTVGNMEANIIFEKAEEYSVTFKYWGEVDFSKIKTLVKDKTLIIHAATLEEHLRCRKFCFVGPSIQEIIIKGPKLQEVTADMKGAQLNLLSPSNQSLKVSAKSNPVYLSDVVTDTLQAERQTDGSWILVFAGAYKGVTQPQEISVFQDTATMTAKKIDLKFDGECGVLAELDTSELVFVNSGFETLTINKKIVGGPKDLRKVQDKPGMSPEKCVQIQKPGLNYYNFKWKDQLVNGSW